MHVRDDSAAMSDEDTDPKAEVGRQLARRRRELNLVQEDLAPLVGVTGRTVSAIERGENAIQVNRRPLWETALHLVAGTLNRAYDTGSSIETLAVPTGEETAPAAKDKLIALLTARVADMTETIERVTSDDRLACLAARVESIEEDLNEERRLREALERTVADLTSILHDGPETT